MGPATPAVRTKAGRQARIQGTMTIVITHAGKAARALGLHVRTYLRNASTGSRL